MARRRTDKTGPRSIWVPNPHALRALHVDPSRGTSVNWHLPGTPGIRQPCRPVWCKKKPRGVSRINRGQSVKDQVRLGTAGGTSRLWRLPRRSPRLCRARPVESGPDGAGDVVASDAPVGSEGSDDVQAVMAVGVGRGRGPWAALVLDFDLDAVTEVDADADGEGSALQAGPAVQRGVGRQLGGTQDHVVCHRAATESHAKVGTDNSELRA